MSEKHFIFSVLNRWKVLYNILYTNSIYIHLPFALSQRPRGDDPQGDHEDQQHRTGADGHQGLKDEPGVKVDAIQGPYATRRRVREKLRVKQHHTTNEVEPEEHGQREGDVVWHTLGADVAVLVCQLGRPQEVVFARNRMNRADRQLYRDLRDPLPGHCDPPVIRAVIDHEQLSSNTEIDRSYIRIYICTYILINLRVSYPMLFSIDRDLCLYRMRFFQ